MLTRVGAMLPVIRAHVDRHLPRLCNRMLRATTGAGLPQAFQILDSQGPARAVSAC